MPNSIPPSHAVLTEAIALSTEILKDLEAGTLPLTPIALKTSRLASLVGDPVSQKIMNYELSGYPATVSSMPPESWDLACRAHRVIEILDAKIGKPKRYVYIESIGKLEEQLSLAQSLLSNGRRPEEIVQAANLLPYVYSRSGHHKFNYSPSQLIEHAKVRLESRRALIHRLVTRKYHELKFSGIADDVFSRIRARVDTIISTYVPDAIDKLTSVHANLRSGNPEDWSNAVHSCRRVLKDLADKVFPPRKEERTVKMGDKKRTIQLGEDNYVNRLIAFVEEKSASQRFKDIVGSHLTFLGDRLDSICAASHKGSHSMIVKREEADRYVIYTYMIVADILSLSESSRRS